MKRGAFLGGLVAATATIVVPERKIWAMGETAIARPTHLVFAGTMAGPGPLYISYSSHLHEIIQEVLGSQYQPYSQECRANFKPVTGSLLRPSDDNPMIRTRKDFEDVLLGRTYDKRGLPVRVDIG